MLRLYIIRHAQTAWNKEGRLQGRADLPLSSRGREQAEKVADRLKKINFHALYTSELKRAYETSQIINRFHHVPIHQDNRLNEIHYGIFEGRTIREIEEHPKLSKYWERRKKNSYQFTIPKGESLEAVEKRAKEALKEIIKGHPRGIIAIICHGSLKRMLIKYLLGMHIDEILKISFRNTAVSVFEIKAGQVELITFNDAAHLEDKV